MQRPRRARNETSPAVRDKDGGLTRVIPVDGQRKSDGSALRG